MKEKYFFIAVLLCFSIKVLSSDYERKAWIEERFMNSIVDSSVIHNEYLFPIVGFECINGYLYIQTCGGELSRIQSKKTHDGYLITNFRYLINLQAWPDSIVEKYAKSKICYKIENEKIILTVKGERETEVYIFTSNVKESRFKSILEIKGWLFDIFMGSINLSPPNQDNHGDGSSDHFSSE